MKRVKQFLVSLTFGVVMLWAMLWRFDLEQTAQYMRDAQTGLLIAGILLMVFAYLVRGARWMLWERSLTYWNSTRLILIGFMGNNLLPARLGEILRAHCAAAKTSPDRGRTTAIASIAAERILDGLVLSAFGLISILRAPVEGNFGQTLLVAGFAFSGLATTFLIGMYFDGRWRTLIDAAHRRFPGHVTAYAREKALQFLDGLLPLRRFTRMLVALICTTLVWGLEAASYYAIARAVTADVTTSTAILLMSVANFASLFPFTSGGIGTIETVAPAFLISTGVAASPALAIVLLQHGFQYFLTTTAGGLCYLTGGFHRIPLGRPKSALTFPTPRAVESATAPIVEEARSALSRLSLSGALQPTPRPAVDLSIVIPAYNEQVRLPRTVLETIRWCTNRQVHFEIIIADDGSTDDTLRLARLFEESDARVRCLACPHMGKGAAVRMGVLNARGGLVLFMDADGATPLDEIPKLVTAIRDGYSVAIGSRVSQRPGDVVVQASFHRRLIGRTFALLVNLLTLDGIGDTQCGLKMFTREASAAIFSRQKCSGFAFDVEILYIARRLSLEIAEVSVNWVAQPGSKLNVLTDSARMLRDIVKVGWSHHDLSAASLPIAAYDLVEPEQSLVEAVDEATGQMTMRRRV